MLRVGRKRAAGGPHGRKWVGEGLNACGIERLTGSRAGRRGLRGSRAWKAVGNTSAEQWEGSSRYEPKDLRPNKNPNPVNLLSPNLNPTGHLSCSRVRVVSIISWFMPKMTLSGVLISCDMLAKKLDFASLDERAC